MDTLIFNPNAGSVLRLGLTAEKILSMLEARGISASLPSVDEHEMVEVAAKATGRVIAVGGDGTLHRLLQAVDRCGALDLAIIPAGTSNHFATSLGIPTDLDEAIYNAAEGHKKKVDLGIVDGTIFTQAAGAGFHARIFHEYGEHKVKSKIDAVIAAGKAFSGWTPKLMEVTIDGQPYLREVTQVTAANTPVYGTIFNIAPGAKLDDGLLDVVIVESLTKVEIVEYAVAAIIGNLENMPKVHRTLARKIELAPAGGENIEVHADEWRIGYAPKTIQVLPGCLNVTVPKEDNA